MTASPGRPLGDLFPAPRAARCALAVLLLAAYLPSRAQTPPPPDQVRAAIASARLGTGYAQMINMSATPDLSAASYTVDGLDPTAKIDLLHLPYQAKLATLSPDTTLDWRIAAGWLQFKQDFPTTLAGQGGSIDSKWSAYSLGAGLLAEYRLGSGFTLVPALDAGVARLKNAATYNGAANVFGPIYDGLLFNWDANAWFVTPSVALEWTTPVEGGTVTVTGHVARSWIGSFDETDPVQHFNEAANIYSVRAEYVHPTSWRVVERPVDVVGYVGYAGFFGANRDVFGFTGVAEVGAGVQVPIAGDKPQSDRVRLSGSYLFGAGVRGWTVGVSLEY
ncbi:MAG: hypothetical protein U1F10_09815 [Burkholderiales bacterium]